MSVFELYRDRATEFLVTGKSNEFMVTTRKGRGTSNSAINNDKSALTQDNTSLENGDLCAEVATGDSYFIIAMQSSSEATRCQLRKTNATIDIVRVTKHFTGSIQDYLVEVPVALATPSFYEDINGKQQMYDAGLLSTTTRRFLMPLNSNVKILDRIKFNGEAMQISAINTSAFPGLMQVQTTTDSRVVKAIP